MRSDRRALDLGALTSGWPASEPPADFVDRVMDACEALDAPRRSRSPAARAHAERRAPIVLCAAALAISLVSLFYSVRPGRDAAIGVASIQVDLGSQPD
jgi:hypothetical protein